MNRRYGFITVFLVICIVKVGSCSRTLQQINSQVVNVLQYGAVGDGVHDDSDAFLAAWTAACGAEIDAVTLLIPKGRTYILNPVSFQGPCTPSTVHVKVKGNLVAADMNSWPDENYPRWIRFNQVNGLTVNGNGVFDGRGADWWAKYGDDSSRPTALTFETCNNLQLRSMTHLNSARNHISIHQCDGVQVSNLQITAPEDSHNTDGIDISRSTGVNIYKCIIATGDDCIAIGGGTANVNISNIGCGPGHGISIGSLGKNGETDMVEDIHVKQSSFYRTQNGARIKTWQGGKGFVRHVSFEDITLIEANNPIIIDQFYCDRHGSSPCKVQSDAVRICDVIFNGFRGTIAGDEAVQLKCSDTYECSDIVLANINIDCPASEKSSSCTNAHGRAVAIINPPLSHCLIP